MRELKFRAWDKKHKIMSTGVSLEWFINGEPSDMEFPKTDESIPLKDFTYYLEDYVIMQSTGLKDKNKIEIFDGDIYIGERSYMPNRGHKKKKYPQRIKVICVVEWSDHDAGWRPKEIGPIPEHKEADENVPYHYYHTSLGSNNGICDWIEVIGNIYDNADLLKNGSM